MRQLTVIATFLLSSFVAHIAYGQACRFDEETHNNPVVRVSLYLINETEACRPWGYAKQCDGWRIDEFLNFAEQNKLKPVFSRVPPEQISLQHLTDAIISYSNRCSVESLKMYCMEPKSRKSVVLFIETNLKDNLPISISRLRSNHSKLPKYTREGELEYRGRWLNHQRADAFLPKNEIEWKLKIGNNKWLFGTQEEYNNQ